MRLIPGISASLCFVLVLVGCDGKKSPIGPVFPCGICGYWLVWHSEQPQGAGPEPMTISQSNGHLTMSSSCRPGVTIGSVVVEGSTVTMVFADGQNTTTARGTLLGTRMSGTWTSTSGESGTWRAEKTNQAPNPYSCVMSTVSVFCVRFQNDQYWVEGVIDDPNHLIASANMTGDYVSGNRALTYDLYGNRPGQWWTDPNVFISDGHKPTFPLNYVVHVRFKGGRSEDVPKTVVTWSWATSDGDRSPGYRFASLRSGASIDFSTGIIDTSGAAGDLRYEALNLIGLAAAPSGVSWWTGEGLDSFMSWISNPVFLPPAEAWTRESGAAGSAGRWTRWLKTRDGRYGMLFSVRVTSTAFDFYYVAPYGAMSWSDTTKPEPPVIQFVRPGDVAGTLVVEWQASLSPDVTGYWLWYGRQPDDRTGRHAGSTRSYVLTGLASGQRYYVWVLGYDREGNQSDYSSAVLGTAR